MIVSVNLKDSLPKQLFQIFTCFAYCIKYNHQVILPRTLDNGGSKVYWDNLFAELKSMLNDRNVMKNIFDLTNLHILVF